MNTHPTESVRPVSGINDQMQKVIGYIRDHGQITDPEIEKLLDVKKTRAFTVVKEMKELGLIRTSGRGKDKKYLIN